MSVPKGPKQIFDYNANGQLVCSAHHQRICQDCRLNSVEREFFDGEDSGFRKYPPISNRNDRGAILRGELARFHPDSDPQIVDPNDTTISRPGIEKLDVATKAPRTYYCAKCQLTWLIGRAGEAAARDHPSHNTYTDSELSPLRSLYILTDFYYTGGLGSSKRGGLAVYFGPGSKFNTKDSFPKPENHKIDSKVGSLTAFLRALEKVRQAVLDDRSSIVSSLEGGDDSWASSAVMAMRVILTSSCHYAVNGMCGGFEKKKWKIVDGKIKNKDGPLAISDALLHIESEVRKLSLMGVTVAYHELSIEDNIRTRGLVEEQRHEDVLPNGNLESKNQV